MAAQAMTSGKLGLTMRGFTLTTSNSRGIIASAILFCALLSSACGKSEAEKAKFLNSLLEPTPYKTKPPAPGDNEPRLYYGLAKQPNYYEFVWIMGKSDTTEKADDRVFYYWETKGLDPSDPAKPDLVQAIFDSKNRLTSVIFSNGKDTLHGDAKKLMGTID